MRATEIIRGVLDLIDVIDSNSEPLPEPDCVETNSSEDELVRLVDLLKHSYQGYDNSPNELVSDIASVTVDAGGGLNGPKQPSDIRSDSISMYPAFQAEKK